MDLLKGIALLFMIYFHIIYDLDVIFRTGVDSASFFNDFTAKASGSLFIFTAGISSSLTRSNFKRALRILGIALAITLLTYLYDPAMVITYGILHLLATGIILSPLFLRMDSFVLIALGVILILGTPALIRLPVPHHWLLFPTGIASDTGVSSDYYPLLPWLGVFLLGMGAGKGLYREKRSLFRAELGDTFINKIGRHTLLIYLIHQPLIIGILSLLAPCIK